jgi:hypothetical protein
LAQYFAASAAGREYEREMSDVVTLLKPLIDKLPLWALSAFALLAIIWCAFKGYWEIRKTRAEANGSNDSAPNLRLPK